MSKDRRPPTVILDLDGTLLKHHGSLSKQVTMPICLLPEARRKLDLWERQGCHIIILTGRKETMREVTVAQLETAGIVYDQLVMGCGGGVRHLVNDRKPNGQDTAFAHNVDRNGGLGNVSI